jgi:hypothetical protein
MLTENFVKQFIDTLGDVKDWHHNGVVIELPFATGMCVCGHQIKFEYVIVNSKTNRKETLGSECINHFKDYSPELYASLIASKSSFAKKKKEEINKEKEEIINKEIQETMVTMGKYQKAINEYGLNLKGSIDDYELYNIAKRNVFVKNNSYKKVSSYLKYLKTELSIRERIINEYSLNVEVLFSNSNKREVLVEKVKKLITNANGYAFVEMVPHGYSDSLYNLEEFIKKVENNEIEEKHFYKIEVIGKTYGIKEYLKDQGFRWNGDAWEKIVDDEKFPVYIPEGTKNVKVWVNAL